MVTVSSYAPIHFLSRKVGFCLKTADDIAYA